tara:strand:+ start:411 stop:566 length:156 start_codon:yes stop_codon:yes gene_type:complete
MPELNTEPAELRFTLEITRKETGKVETVEMVGHIIKEEENKHGSNTLNSSS